MVVGGCNTGTFFSATKLYFQHLSNPPNGSIFSITVSFMAVGGGRGSSKVILLFQKIIIESNFGEKKGL